MKKKTATIILNRNLPIPTDKLFNKIKKYNKDYTDIFIVDAGSQSKLISKNTTWVANWKSAKKNGLRFARGMNFALDKMIEEKIFKNYEFFLLLTNDSEVEKKQFIKKLSNILKDNPKIGILSPCSKKWGEKFFLKKEKIKFFWYIHNNAYFIRRKFIEKILNKKKPGYINLLFDGSNFRGYGLESELIAKAYKNNWAAAITSDVWVEENESYLLNHSKVIKTENFDENLKLYIDEGYKWMKKKYGFMSKWSIQMYVKRFYDDFFKKNPNLQKFKI
mgnify:CR=1 FL=1|tara:strand:- start:22797 stop:23624 length:828 start_codon:yes stop_codon:yes gene_type:complete